MELSDFTNMSEDVKILNGLTAGVTITTNPVSQEGSKRLSQSRGQKSLNPVSEESFMTAVIHYAHLNGWRVAHFRAGLTQTGRWRTAVQGDGKGFPDLVLVRKKTCLFVELKSEKGIASEDQQNWWRDLVNAGMKYRLWKPSDWKNIEKELESLEVL